MLLDPPCSGLGQRPRFEDLRKAAELEAAAAYQHELMAAAMRVLTRRSMLVYSKCSISSCASVSSCAALWQPAVAASCGSQRLEAADLRPCHGHRPGNCSVVELQHKARTRLMSTSPPQPPAQQTRPQA